MTPKPVCPICEKPVLVSKQTSTEDTRDGVTTVWHNVCLAGAREALAMQRLIDVCGSVELAERVRKILPYTAGSLTTREP